MTEEQKAQALGAWLSGPLGAPPPEGMDPEVVEAVYALHPHRAPAARVTADDILASLTAGPLARAENLAEDPDSGPLAEVVPFPKRPDPRAEAPVVVADEPAANTPMRRRWFGPQIVGAIGVAAGLLLAARVGWVALEGQPGPATMAEDLPGLTAPSEVLRGPRPGARKRPPSPEGADLSARKTVAGLEAPVASADPASAEPEADGVLAPPPPPPPPKGISKEMSRATGPRVDEDERQIPMDFAAERDANDQRPTDEGSVTVRDGNLVAETPTAGQAPTTDSVLGGEAQNVDDLQQTIATGAANGAGASVAEGLFNDSRKSADKVQPPEVAAAPVAIAKDSAGAKARPVAQKPAKSPAAPAAEPAPTPTLADPRSTDEESKKRAKAKESAEAEEVATVTQGDTLYRGRDASNVGDGRYDGLTRAGAVPTDYYAVLSGYDAETQGQIDAAMASAQAKMMAGDPSGAAQALLTASTGQTQANQHLAILAAQRYLGLGDFKKAKVAAQKGLSLSSANSPERSQLFLIYGDALQASGDEAGARRAWKDAAALNQSRRRYDDAQPMKMEDADHK